MILIIGKRFLKNFFCLNIYIYRFFLLILWYLYIRLVLFIEYDKRFRLLKNFWFDLFLRKSNNRIIKNIVELYVLFICYYNDNFLCRLEIFYNIILLYKY